MAASTSEGMAGDNGTGATAAGASPEENTALLVTTAADTVDDMDGVLSLREAVALANADADASAISFDPAVFTGGAASLIRLTGGELEITAELTIDGSTGTDIILTGDAGNDDFTPVGSYITDVTRSGTDDLDDNSRIFNVSSSTATTAIHGLTLTGGRTTADDAHGGAIISQAGLTLVDTTISGNSTAGQNAQGGGIYAAGALTLTGSTVSDNIASGLSSDGGGIAAMGTLVLTGSTISGNATAGTSAKGGGVYGASAVALTNSSIVANTTTGDSSGGAGVYALGAITLLNSTVTANVATGAASDGGGLYSQTSIDLTNSIVLGNVAPATLETDVSVSGGAPTYAGLNIVGTGADTDGSDGVINADAAAVFAATTDAVDGTGTATGTTAGVLADNGGTVQTVALNTDVANPALDAGNDTLAPTTDALGQTRVDLPGAANNGAAISDLGAVEAGELGSLVVTTANDTVDATDGLTSLREAIAYANNAFAGAAGDGDADNDGNDLDTITFASGMGAAFENGGLIRLSQGTELVVSSAVLIDGSSAGGAVTITGDSGGNDSLVAGTDLTDVLASNAAGTLTDNTRVLYFDGSSDGSAIDQLTITGGLDVFGGGLYARFSDVTVTDSTFDGNYALGGGGLYFRFSDFTLSGTTVSNNRAAFTVGGGLLTNTDMAFVYKGYVANSTFHGNHASYSGGGIENIEGLLYISNSTIVGNTAGQTGGGVTSKGDSQTSTTVTSTIIAGNTATVAGADVGLRETSSTFNSFTSGGNNLIGDGQFQADSGTISLFTDGTGNDIVGQSGAEADPLLGPLQDNGGPTPTLQPQAGSPVIDTGANPLMLTTDQRGTGFDRETGGGADIGATEALASIVVTTTNDTVLNDGLTSLREALALANAGDGDGDGSDADRITFDSSLQGSTITLRAETLTIDSDVTIDADIGGDGTQDVTVSGNGRSRVFTVNTGTSDISGLVIADGNADMYGTGGGIYLDTGVDLTLTNVTLSGNQALDGDGGFGSYEGYRGGGIYARSGSVLSVVASTITGNRAGDAGYNSLLGPGYRGGDGGGIWSAGTVTITDSVIQNNRAGKGGLGTDIGYGYAGGNGGSGGGIWSSGTLTIADSTIDGNSAGTGERGGFEDPLFMLYSGGGTGGNGGSGGGILSTGTLVITGTTISDNAAGDGANGGYGGTAGGFGGTGGSGGGLRASGTTTIVNSTVLDNVAGSGGAGGRSASYSGNGYAFTYYGGDGGSGGSGGGLGLTGGSATLIGVTAAANNAGTGGAGGYGPALNGNAGAQGDGGGILNSGATLDLILSTVTGNTALSTGGGVAATGGATSLSNTVVLANTGGDVDGTLSAEIASLTTGTASDIFDTIDAITGGGALADNGGPVQTVALKADLANPAIDTGTDAVPTETDLGVDVNGDGDTDDAIDTDPRGATRPIDVLGNGALNDIGAYEMQTTPTEGPDILLGSAGNDTLDALGGNDLLLGTEGADMLDGGGGNDTVSYETSTDGVEVDLSTGLGTGGDAEGDQLGGIEHVVGSAEADRITGDDDANSLFGLGGNDILKGGLGADVLDGGEGFNFADYSDAPDALTIDLATPSNSTPIFSDDTLIDIEGLFGAASFTNDFTGDAARTFFTGGDQSDTLRGEGAGDILRGRAGNDVIYGGDDSDALLGNTGNDTLFGGAGPDVFWFGYGDEGDNVIKDFDLGNDLLGFQGDNVNAFGDLTFGESTNGFALITWSSGTSSGSVELENVLETDANTSGVAFFA